MPFSIASRRSTSTKGHACVLDSVVDGRVAGRGSQKLLSNRNLHLLAPSIRSAYTQSIQRNSGLASDCFPLFTQLTCSLHLFDLHAGDRYSACCLTHVHL